jgi:hypothetical protein
VPLVVAEQELALLASVADEEEQVTLVRPRVDDPEVDLALAAREAGPTVSRPPSSRSL